MNSSLKFSTEKKKKSDIIFIRKLNRKIMSNKFWLLFGIFITATRKSTLAASCGFDECNNEGICTLEGGQNKCKCIETVYTGATCGIMVNYCVKEPCSSANTIRPCVPFPSASSCVCAPGFVGQKCKDGNEKSDEYYVDFRFYYNRIMDVNKPSSILVTFEKLGTILMDINILTEDYAIATVPFPNSEESRIFKHSDNIRDVAKSCGIKKSDLVPETPAYYLTADIVLSRFGIEAGNVWLVLQDGSSTLYNMKFEMYGNIDENACHPSIENTICYSPHSPINLQINERHSINHIIKNGCDKTSKLSFKWEIRNYFDMFQLRELDSTKPTLDIEPYTLQLKTTKEIRLLSMYVLKLTVNEEFESKSGYTISRCYIRVIQMHPQVIIAGGEKRQIYEKTDSPYLNASESYDGNYGPKSKSPLSFQWSCQSEKDPGFCKNLAMDLTKPTLHLPIDQMKLTAEYTFEVVVISIESSMESAGWQTITFVQSKVLDIQIICLKNCLPAVNVNEKTFFKPKCNNCEKGSAIKYEWFLDEASYYKGKRLIIAENTVEYEKTYSLHLKAAQNGLEGNYWFEFYGGRKPDTKGKCDITPKSGTPILTYFKLNCAGYAGQYEYQIFQGETMMHRLKNGNVKFRLFEGSNKVSVRVVNSAGIWSNNEQLIVFETLNIGSSLADIIKFLDGDGTVDVGLKKRIELGDNAGAIMMSDTAIRRRKPLTNDEQVKLTAKILDSLKDLDLTSEITQIELLSDLISKIVDMDLSSELAQPIFELINKVMDKLKVNADENKSLDKVLYDKITDNIFRTMEKLFDKFEEIPPPQMDEPPNEYTTGEENYPDYSEFDADAIKHVVLLENLTKTTKNVFSTIGTVTAKLLEVGENVKTISNDHFEFSGSTMDVDDTPTKIIEKPNTKLSFDTTNYGTDEITVSSTFFKKNPLWTHPLYPTMDADIGVLTITDRDGKSLSGAPIDVAAKLTENKDQFQTINGIVQNTDEMEIYKIRYHNGSLLIIEITGKSSVRLAVRGHRPPLYTDFLKNGRTPPAKIPFHDKRDQVVYIGVITSMSSKSMVPRQIIDREDYKLQFQILACHTWNTDKLRWAEKNCVTMIDSTSLNIKCRCDPLTMFTARATPPEMMPTQTYERQLVKKLPHSWLIFVVIITIFIVYALFCWYTLRQDVKDKLREYYFLKDNHPRHTYTYFIKIGTGYISQRKTTSVVALQLIGEFGESRIRIINLKHSSREYKMLEPRALGPITAIDLTTNYAGYNPIWRCTHVNIHDLDQQQDYTFPVHKTFDGTNITHRIEHTETPVQAMKSKVWSVCKDHFLTLSIFTKSNTKKLSRTNRLNLLLLRVMNILLVTVCFMGPTNFLNLNDHQYVGVVIWLAFVSAAIAYAFEKLVILVAVNYVLFRNCKTNRREENRSE